MKAMIHENGTVNNAEATAAAHPGNVKSYTVGFLLSLVLTAEAFLLVGNHTFSHGISILILLGMAIVQLLVQLFFFLHLDQPGKTRWNITAFLFMGLVVAIVVYGSLWIMQNLNYHMKLTPAETNQSVEHEEGITPRRY